MRNSSSIGGSPLAIVVLMERIIVAPSPDCASTMFSDQFRIKEVVHKWKLKGDALFTEVSKIRAWVMGGVIVNLIAPIQLVMGRSNIAQSSTCSNDISCKEAG